ncbi:MAG TPA: hypothetical protein VI759_07345 [Dehalococcoidia bacterium]|nr:hypothetical protein [Dehalococcoidia bacterium]
MNHTKDTTTDCAGLFPTDAETGREADKCFLCGLTLAAHANAQGQVDTDD